MTASLSAAFAVPAVVASSHGSRRRADVSPHGGGSIPRVGGGGRGGAFSVPPSCRGGDAASLLLLRKAPRGGWLGGKQQDGDGLDDGGSSMEPVQQQQDQQQEMDEKKKKIRNILIASASIALATWKREYILSSLRAVPTSDLRSWLITKLDALEALGMPGLVVYTILFALWEVVIGVTTPVETAAGMAFGFRNGLIASSIGKIGGAIAAFCIGRFLLFDYVTDKLKGNEMMDLVRESILTNPVGVALVWRFSFLPEQVKTFGLAVLPLKVRHFVAAVVLHGLPFTCLWTCMGAEAGALARGVVSGPSRLLKVLVAGVYLFGFFISPTMVGLWVKSLKDKQKERREGK